MHYKQQPAKSIRIAMELRKDRILWYACSAVSYQQTTFKHCTAEIDELVNLIDQAAKTRSRFLGFLVITRDAQCSFHTVYASK